MIRLVDNAGEDLLLQVEVKPRKRTPVLVKAN
jgi:hypothetical protein